MRWPNSLFFRLLLPLAVTLSLAMVVAWLIALGLLMRVIETRLDAQLASATETLADGAFPFSEDLLARLDRLTDARIAVLDASGEAGISSLGNPAAPVWQAIGARTQEFEDEALSAITIDAGRETWRAVIRPLRQARDDRFEYVVAAASLSATDRVARNAALLLAAAMLASLLVLAWVGSVLTRSITTPVADLADMAKRIASGKRDVRSKIEEQNEIGVLGKALTDMAEELNNYEKDLAAASRQAGLGDLAARMAHELRNPLTAIKMQLELLEERLPTEEKARINGVVDEIRRLELIVNSSLAIGGSQSLNPAPSDIGSLIGEVADLMLPSLKHRNIELATDIGRMPRLAVDGDRMKQVFLNLINNAADEMPRGGRILISAGIIGNGGAVEISVEDSGPGLGDESGTPASRKPLGLGLGLKISREIVERHGGRLTDGRSDHLGGAKFTLRLPVTIMAT